MNSTIHYQMRKNPKIGANVLSRLSLSWLLGLLNEGRKKNLSIENLYEISEQNKSKHLGDVLEKHWNDELSKHAAKNDEKPSLKKALLKTFYPTMIKQFITLFLVQTTLTILGPFFLGKLIENYTNYQDGLSEDYSFVYMFAGLLFLNSFLISFVSNNYTKSALLLGMKARIACSSLIYRKMLRLKISSLSETSNGQLTNLLSNDVNRFDKLFLHLHYLFTIPFQFIVTVIYVWHQVQVASIVGFIVLILLTIPFQGLVGRYSVKFRAKIAKLTDKRVTLMNEIISGIQVIKMYAWEIPFEKFVETARFNEIKIIKASNTLRAASFSGINFTERITMFSVTVCFIALGNALTSVKVFSIFQCFKMLQRSLSFNYPLATLITTEASVSIQRIQKFLSIEEKNCTNTAINKIRNDLDIGEISIQNYSASWVKHKQVIQNITSTIKAGEICAIIGPVGSGKSSLLNGLLSEINKDSGRMDINGTISYSSQQPWLFGGSVRDNILFGLPYDETKYKQVVEVCALREDFLQFPYGDDTLVGNKGGSMSGGQRARINLARAIYRDANIYLLDDPLSAVDANVGKFIFHECIEKYLHNKTRILVTHQIQHLQNVNQIIVLKNGEIEAEGNYNELVATKLEFTKYLNSKIENDDSNDVANEKTDIDIKVPEATIISSEKIKPQLKNEEVVKNKLEMNLFYKYFSAAGSVWKNLFLLILFAASHSFNILTDFWVSYWTNLEEVRNKKHLNEPKIVFVKLSNNSTHHAYSPDVAYELDDNLLSTFKAIEIYGILLILIIIFGFVKNFYLMSLCMKASKNLHNMIFTILCRAPMRFFDTNPIGRILNRFTKDMGTVDEVLPRSFMHSSYIIALFLSVGILISIMNPYLILPTIILIALIIKIQDIYMSTAQDVTRLEGITKSPVFTHTSATFEGLTTIRACKAQESLLMEYDQHQDIHTSTSYIIIVCNVCLGLFVDFVCLLYLMSVTSCIVFFSRSFTGSEVGLTLSAALNLLFIITFGIKESSEMINQMTCVERILQYTKVEPESPYETPKDSKIPDKWPQKGHIKFNKLSLRYDQNEPNVLKDLNLEIRSREKIGVVGRTGAGKSSFISSLFRLSIIDGDIIVDDIFIKNIGLRDLRSKISVIPQQPVLFTATMRFNLDPFGDYEDHALWSVLEEVEMKNVVPSLDFEIQSGGTNFSIGQRQLICLARAILKQNKILVLDEATANVDPHTDALIQQTIRDKFKHCTMITIAHRLNTIMDADKVLVMDAGQMVEFDHPYKLLLDKNGMLYKLAQETGPSMAENLFNISKKSYFKDS